MPKSTVVSLLLLVVLAIACAPVGTPSSDPSRQQQVEQYAAELPWPTDHITYRAETAQAAQHPNANAISDCPSRTVRIFPSAFDYSPEGVRWIVAHETGHQRDCDGLPDGFYNMIADYGTFTPHSSTWNVGEGLADCMAEYWLGYAGGGYWDCPDEIIARIPEWAPN